jgi:hypothetical protein
MASGDLSATLTQGGRAADRRSAVADQMRAAAGMHGARSRWSLIFAKKFTILNENSTVEEL